MILSSFSVFVAGKYVSGVRFNFVNADLLAKAFDKGWGKEVCTPAELLLMSIISFWRSA